MSILNNHHNSPKEDQFDKILDEVYHRENQKLIKRVIIVCSFVCGIFVLVGGILWLFFLNRPDAAGNKLVQADTESLPTSFETAPEQRTSLDAEFEGTNETIVKDPLHNGSMTLNDEIIETPSENLEQPVIRQLGVGQAGEREAEEPNANKSLSERYETEYYASSSSEDQRKEEVSVSSVNADEVNQSEVSSVPQQAITVVDTSLPQRGSEELPEKLFQPVEKSLPLEKEVHSQSTVLAKAPTHSEKVKPLKVSEVAPLYPDGEKAMLKFFHKELDYPELASRHEIKGIVFVQFIVNANGQLSDFKVVRGIGFGCDEEALRVAKKMPEWEPGKEGGQNVPVIKVIPIKFSF